MPLKGSTFATRQRRIVREAVARYAHPFTARDVCEALAPLEPKVSRATVFRVISAMTSEGRVREIVLFDRRRVLVNVSGDSALCLMECSECGRLACSQPPGLTRSLEQAAESQKLRPQKAAIYVQAECVESHCAYRKTSSSPSKRHQDFH
jgi:Fe2+ or Zn2+ uptake regulation protein